jgi:Ca2+-binding RTX toxin-like protein
VTVNVLANDTDADSDVLTLDAVDTTSANGGTIQANSDGTVTYTPAASFSGPDTFSYTVTDGQGGSATATVSATVEAADVSPPTDEGNGVVNYSTAQRGVVLNLETAVALSPVFGSLANPKLMPMGDSITEGDHSIEPVPGAYRTQFWQRAIADGLITSEFSIDFVGSETESESVSGLGDVDHQGHRGWRIDQVLQRRVLSSRDVIGTYTPDVVMVMLGANDVSNDNSADEIINKLNELVDGIQSKASGNSLILVSSLTPFDPSTNLKNIPQSRADTIAEVNSRIETEVTNGQDVLFADAGGRLTIADINDGIHPTQAGYDLLGDYWYEAVFNPADISGKRDLIGSAFDDRLIGDSGNNVLTGGLGQDELIGNGGADTFKYQQAVAGVDNIADFSENDMFQMSAAGFGGDLAVGILETSRFIVGSGPIASEAGLATFLFDNTTSMLSFDVDGSGGQEALELARLTNNFMLQANHIQVVA